MSGDSNLKLTALKHFSKTWDKIGMQQQKKLACTVMKIMVLRRVLRSWRDDGGQMAEPGGDPEGL